MRGLDFATHQAIEDPSPQPSPPSTGARGFDLRRTVDHLLPDMNRTLMAEVTNRRRRRRTPWVLGLLGLVAVAGIVWGALSWSSARRRRAEINRARTEMDAGLFATAHGRLRALSRAHPGEAETLYTLGLCEKALGRLDEALTAWTWVVPGSSWFPRAAVEAGAAFINTGRYRSAEEILLRALPETRDPADALKVRRELSRLYRFEGRMDDIRWTLHSSWPVATDRPALLKELWLLDNSPQPIQAWSLALSKADPGDDRVWLGRAAVAILTGRYEEASDLLARCPDDPAVWRARLDLALASDDEPAAWRASARLASGGLAPSVRAWMLTRRPDRAAEGRALRDLIAADPGNAPAVDRLAALESDAGRRAEAEALRRKKIEIDRAKDRVRTLLLGSTDLTTSAAEFSRLTGLLGRRFDAWAWACLAPGSSTNGPPPADPALSAAETPADSLAAALVSSGLSPTTKAPARVVAAKLEMVPRFRDAAEAAGLSFTFDNGATPFCQLPETMSGGVAVLDYDGDGWLDVYVVQGGAIAPDPTAGEVPNGDRLFRNNRDGTFRDTTEAVGIASFSRDYGLGVTVGDYNGDGRPDLFVTRLRSYALYRNEGNGGFRDVTESAGLAGPRDNPTSAAFADLDGDGDLDLYVCHYMKWDPADPRLCKDDKGKFFYCDPSKVDPAPDHVFRNDRGRFMDVTREAGFTDPDGRGLGVVAADLDGDGKVDLYVANDGTANYFFHNLGGFQFEETGLAAGVASGPEGGYQASMGVACGDYDGDGLPDLAVTNFYGESSTLYRNLGGGLFRDQTAASGLGAATRYLLGFGTAFADVNNDGRLDLVTANGHVNDNRPYYPYAMPSQLLMGQPGGRFADASDKSGDVWRVPRVGRGLAAADLDNDGRLDLLILGQNEPLAYLHNRGPSTGDSGRFVTFLLEGSASNRDGVGALVTITAEGRRQVAPRFGGGSYQSSGDPRLHFGLGTASAVDSVEVHWPSGRLDRFARLAPDLGYLLREGASAPSPLKGFAR